MRYLYYTLFRLLTLMKPLKLGISEPGFTAMMLITVFQLFNIATIALLAANLVHMRYDTKNFLLGGMCVFAVLMAVNFFILYWRASNLISKYENETDKEKVNGVFYLLGYLMLTIITTGLIMPSSI
jgi:hypothetical protein